MKRTLFAAALLLTACNQLASSDMPDLNDPDAVKAAILKLDPIAPGSKSTDHGVYGIGQPGSERNLFVQWLQHYENEDASRRLDIDYEPPAAPATIAEAIAEQRKIGATAAANYVPPKERIARFWASKQADLDKQERADQARHRETMSYGDKLEAQRSAEISTDQQGYDGCNRQREAAQAQQPLTDDYATYRSYECERRFPKVSPH